MKKMTLLLIAALCLAIGISSILVKKNASLEKAIKTTQQEIAELELKQLELEKARREAIVVAESNRPTNAVALTTQPGKVVVALLYFIGGSKNYDKTNPSWREARRNEWEALGDYFFEISTFYPEDKTSRVKELLSQENLADLPVSQQVAIAKEIGTNL